MIRQTDWHSMPATQLDRLDDGTLCHDVRPGQSVENPVQMRIGGRKIAVRDHTRPCFRGRVILII